MAGAYTKRAEAMLVTPHSALTTTAECTVAMAPENLPKQILTFKYRVLPTRRQHLALAAICEDQRQLYNAALEERIGCYRKTGKIRTYVDQCHALVEWRQSDTAAAAIPSNIHRWTLRRLDDAYKAFFRRLRVRNGKAGFPRFRGKGRWDSFGFNEMSGIRFNGKRLRWRTLPGGLRVHLHRPLPIDADIRSCVFRHDRKGWAVCFQVAVQVPGKCPISSAVGLDLGLKVFAYQSDGVATPNPRVARKAEKAMRLRQRALSRCKRGSNRRRKVRCEVTRLHAKIANTRATWLHQQSARIAKSYDLIAVENLNVSGMVKHPTLARSISDASWSKFLAMLDYKAERAGGRLIRVDPRNTSQRCSGCGELVPKSLAVRTHSCPSCGLVIDRDWNAARNILQAVVGLGQPNVGRQPKRAGRKIAGAIL
jgi:putative transposase